MTAVLGLLPAWAWRWLGIAAVASSAALAFYWKGVQHEEAKFDEYRAQVEAEGKKQNAIAREKEKTWQTLVEATNREAQLRTDRLAADVRAARLHNDALAGGRFVPESTGPTSGSGRVCYSSEQLNRGLREALGRLYGRATELAEQGQRARDIAATCSSYVQQLNSGPSKTAPP